jgi:undecaprenyl-diphosphatase
MKKNKEVIIFGIVILLIMISFYFDSVFVKGVSLIRNGILDQFFLFVTHISSEIILFVGFTALFLWKDHKRRWILPLWVTFAISAIIGVFLKITIQRPRPFQLGIVSLLPVLQEASYSIWSFSFPSNHALLAFCAIPILSEQYPKLKKLWIAIAIIVAFSRVYFGLHFFSDVLAGGLIGYVIGMLVVKLEKETQFGKKTYNKIFRKNN